jgi:hypothetical protein
MVLGTHHGPTIVEEDETSLNYFLWASGSLGRLVFACDGGFNLESGYNELVMGTGLRMVMGDGGGKDSYREIECWGKLSQGVYHSKTLAYFL